nr:hypothetical protein [Tanacetum cinerariifolium]
MNTNKHEYNTQPDALDTTCYHIKTHLSGGLDNMANKNVSAPAPTRSDDQILPFTASVPIVTPPNLYYAAEC